MMQRIVTVQAKVTHTVHVQFVLPRNDAVSSGMHAMADLIEEKIMKEAKESAKDGRFFDAQVGHVEFHWRDEP